MKPVKQAIVLVDTHRRAERMRNTSGRYKVGAKTESEAEDLVRKAIGFGSVQFYYWDEKNTSSPIVPYKTVMKEKYIGHGKFTHEKPHHACDKQKDNNDI